MTPARWCFTPLENLANTWGYRENAKGYRVLNGVNIIQGDGMQLESIKQLYQAVLEAGYSPENVAVGMGGGTVTET